MRPFPAGRPRVGAFRTWKKCALKQSDNPFGQRRERKRVRRNRDAVLPNVGTKSKQESLNRFVNLAVVPGVGNTCERMPPHEQKFKNQNGQAEAVVVWS